MRRSLRRYEPADLALRAVTMRLARIGAPPPGLAHPEAALAGFLLDQLAC